MLAGPEGGAAKPLTKDRHLIPEWVSALGLYAGIPCHCLGRAPECRCDNNCLAFLDVEDAGLAQCLNVGAIQKVASGEAYEGRASLGFNEARAVRLRKVSACAP